MSSCFKDYSSRPFDYQISSDSYRKLFEDRDQRHFDVTIEGVTYDFTFKIYSDSSINYLIKTTKDEKMLLNIAESFSLDDVSESNESENIGRNKLNISKSNISQNEKREILRRLFLGKSIMVDDLNISFLHHVADAINLPELSQIKDISQESFTKLSNHFIFHYKPNIFYIKHSFKSFLFRFWTNFFDFFCFFGFFGRLLQSFWDLSGPTMILCLFLNILILFVTMALVTLKDYLVWFFIVVIPLLLYSLYFPNIMCIPIIEALERNLYLKDTFFYSHQKLVSIFIKIVFNVNSIPQYVKLGKLHSFIHGVLFFAFMCGFLANVMNDKAPRFLNVWMIIFAFCVPLVRYFSLYIIYLVHSITSLFNGPRKRFLEIGDFDDPFLCSFYLNERSWIDFILTKKEEKKRKIINFIFSKTTFSLLATVAVIVYMFCAETKMSAGQVCITIFIGICMIFVLATRISFPFFWIHRRRDRRLTEGKIDEMHENIKFSTYQSILQYREAHDDSESQYMIEEDDNSSALEDDEMNNYEINSDEVDVDDVGSETLGVDDDVKMLVMRKVVLKWHRLATTWSKRYSFLRWCSGILVCLVFLFVVILVAMGGSTAISTSNESSNYQSNVTINRPADWNNTNSTNVGELNETFRFPLSPVCSLKTKGLSIIEIIALSMLANPPAPDNFTDDQWQIVDEFLAEKGEVGKDIIFVNTPFKWDKSFQSSMALTRFRREPKLSVFTIRGTANPQDVIADAEIWFASVVINIMNSFFPLVSIYSDKAIELIGVVTNLPRYAFKQFSLVEEYKNRFVDYIYEYIYGGVESMSKTSSSSIPSSALNWLSSRRKKKSLNDIGIHIDPDEDVLIIGHSLGGGLAKIISLVTGIQAVALSGPGVRFIGHFYQNKTVKNIRETIVDVIPGQDLIARVDMPIGTQINVPCKRGMSCHDTYRLICQVSVMCNAFKKHKEYCESKFDQETINEMIDIGEVIT